MKMASRGPPGASWAPGGPKVAARSAPGTKKSAEKKLWRAPGPARRALRTIFQGPGDPQDTPGGAPGSHFGRLFLR